MPPMAGQYRVAHAEGSNQCGCAFPARKHCRERVVGLPPTLNLNRFDSFEPQLRFAQSIDLAGVLPLRNFEQQTAWLYCGVLSCFRMPVAWLLKRDPKLGGYVLPWNANPQDETIRGVRKHALELFTQRISNLAD